MDTTKNVFVRTGIALILLLSLALGCAQAHHQGFHGDLNRMLTDGQIIAMSYVHGPGVRHWHSIDTVFSGVLPGIQTVTNSGAWPTANPAIYIPVYVRQRVVVKQLWFASGATGTGNYDIGLYDAQGVAVLRRGSTAKPATVTETVWDCRDTTIGPGIYFLALASSNNTDSFLAASPAAPFCAAMGVYTETSGLPLPSTATFAVPQTLAYRPVIGMFLDTRVA